MVREVAMLILEARRQWKERDVIKTKGRARVDPRDRHFFSCSICGGNRFKRIYSSGLFSYKQTVSVRRNCGVVCLNPRWDEHRYEQYYEETYYGNYQPKIIANADVPSSDKLSARGLKIFRDLKVLLERDATIVEIGCGSGNNLLVFKRNGFENLTGIDPSPDCCHRLKKLNIKGINTSLASYVLSSPGEEFDCVILSAVLEHFVEPEKALEMITRILKPTGILFIFVPDFYGYSYGYGKPYRQFTTPHTFYFSKASLEMLLKNTGFIVHKYLESPADEIHSELECYRI